MHKLSLYIYVLIMLFVAVNTVQSQNIFVLEKPALKNYKYYQGSFIRLKGQSEKISGTISFISDSSLIIDDRQEVLIRNISKVYTKRWGFSLLQNVLLAMGIPYLLVSTLNGAVNSNADYPDNNSLAISGGIILAGIALTPLTSRTHKIDSNGKWKVMILDMTEESISDANADNKK